MDTILCEQQVIQQSDVPISQPAHLLMSSLTCCKRCCKPSLSVGRSLSICMLVPKKQAPDALLVLLVMHFSCWSCTCPVLAKEDGKHLRPLPNCFVPYLVAVRVIPTCHSAPLFGS